MIPIGELNLPAGFGFNPMDHEVIEYLKRKILRQELPSNIISVVHTDPYSRDPEDLPLCDSKYFKKDEWYFFGIRPSCDLISRELATDNGFYKLLWEDIIMDWTGHVGYKRLYRFMRGVSAKPTDWTIFEYRLNPDAFLDFRTDPFISSKVSTFVVCKVIQMRLRKYDSWDL